MNVLHWSWESLVLAMIHSLWESAIAAAALWLFLRLLPAKRTAIRYIAAIAALGIILLSTMATWSMLDARRPVSTAAISTSSVAGVADPGIPASATPATDSPAAPAMPPGIPWTTATGWAWLSGALLMLLRTGMQLTSAEQLVRSGRLTPTGPLAGAVADVAAKLRLRRTVRLVIHETWNIPAVVGCFWPTLLLPASIASGCPAWQLQFIIAHELAHIRRFDFLVNICQQVVEAVLFFNPAVWWISRQIRIEREACCDAIAVRLADSPQQAAATLADFGSRLFASTAAMTLGGRPRGGRGGGQLLDRIRRIIFPQSRPWIAAPWYGAAVAIGVAILILAGLHIGTEKAVTAVQGIFVSPKDMEKIAAFQNAMPIDDSEHPRHTLLHCTVRTADGAPLPRGGFIHFVAETAHFSEASAEPLDPKGICDLDVAVGTIWLVIGAPGYAPLATGPLHADASAKIAPVGLVVDRGFPASVVVTDNSGRPIPGATVDASICYGSSTFPYRRGESDGKGVYTIDHADAGLQFQFDCTAAGYEFTRQKMRFTPGVRIAILLSQARLTSGIVTDTDSGKPIAGASISLIRQTGFAETRMSPFDNWPPIVNTDAQGRFALDTLRADSQYGLLVAASGHGDKVVWPVLAGQTGLRWELGQPWVIHGRITGDLSRLEHDAKGPLIRIRESFKFDNDNQEEESQEKATRVSVKDGIGVFQLQTAVPGAVEIEIPGQRGVKVKTAEIPPVVELHIESASRIVSQRTVVFHFDIPVGVAPPQGKLQVWKYDPIAQAFAESSQLPVIAGVVKTQIAVPGKVNYSGDGTLVGYWVSETMYGVDIPAGKDPYVVHIPAVPAGAIRGRVLETDGSACQSFTVSRMEIIRSPLVQQSGNIQPIRSDGSADGAFLLTPLPLNGTYQLIATSADRIITSDLVALDGRHPLHDLTLTFPAGSLVRVNVLGVDGHPKAGVEVALTFIVPRYGSFTGLSKATDRAGAVLFEHVNGQAGGTYRLDVRSGNDYPGCTVPIQIDSKPVNIKLQQGLLLTGQVVNDITGKPIAHAVVNAEPTYSPASPNPDRTAGAQAVADDNGRFTFRNLDPYGYALMVADTDPAGSIREKRADGMVYTTYPNLKEYHAGAGNEVTVRVLPK